MKDGSDLGARVTELVLRYLASAPDRAEPVVRFAAPVELEAAFRAAGAYLPLGPAQPPLSDDALLAAVETTLRYSVPALLQPELRRRLGSRRALGR